MKISTILDHIDSGYMALPEFQRGYVWNGDQVRKLFASLYLRRPVGGLLVWVTESRKAAHRGGAPLAPGVVKLLLDGQQRMKSLYGVIRGRPPKFFDGNAKAFTGLSQPVAVLLNEADPTLALASQAGYRCFTSVEDFRRYVSGEVLAAEAVG